MRGQMTVNFMAAFRSTGARQEAETLYVFVVRDLARYMQNPGPEHIAAAKHALRYILGTYDNAGKHTTANPMFSINLILTAMSWWERVTRVLRTREGTPSLVLWCS